MNTLATLLKPLASLKLTVTLLALAMVLVFAGTWAQIDFDVWSVQKKYFHSFFTWIDLQLFLPRPAPGAKPIRGGFPMPGGYTIIVLLLINLLTAHALRFKFHWLDILIPAELALIVALAWPTYQLGFYVMFAVIFAASIPLVMHALLLHQKRGGIVLIHLGLILLICGEVITSIWQRENHLIVNEGQTVNYVQNSRDVELAVIDTSPSEHDDVVSIPQSRLRVGAQISYPTLPFTIRVEDHYTNSSRLGPVQAQQMGVTAPRHSTAGEGTDFIIVPRPNVTGMSNRRNAPSAFVTLTSNDGSNLGTYLVSFFLAAPQQIEVNGKTYLLDLRSKREYRPYSVTLIDFAFDRYTGTNVPKNYSSLIRLVDPERDEDRQVKIWMNHPLRYRGETFFQSDFDQENERYTVLQVVRNPGWVIPYASCSIVTIGMLVHFGAHLIAFLKRNSLPRTSAPLVPSGNGDRRIPFPSSYTLNPKPGFMWSFVAVGACALFVLSQARPPRIDSPFNLHGFSRLPISYDGRVMPFDSLARSSLKVLGGRSELKLDDGTKLPAIRFLIDVLSQRDEALRYKVFRISHPDLLDLLELDAKQRLYSYEQIMRRIQPFQAQADRLPRNKREITQPFQRAVFDLAEHLTLFNRLLDGRSLHIAPPVDRSGSGEWKTLEVAGAQMQANPSAPNPGLASYIALVASYHNNDPEAFNSALAGYSDWLATNHPRIVTRMTAEVLFNCFEPFYNAIILYGIVFVTVCASWLITPVSAGLRRTALWILLLTVAYHTIGLAARIFISGRPPVTNLYSSAIFIGLGAAVMCIAIELIFRNGVGSLAAAVVAFPSLIVAHFLALAQADTMQMLQAVLDTNFWLATHVVIITLGYAATFLAGMLAVVYVVGGVIMRFAAGIDDAWRRVLVRMTYGIICFAMLFSFVGTVLGGIWADQSWGRFWGWDPKENGAVLIVLWNAIILHARWSGLARDRGVMNLAIFGNVVTSWSWFGTNMLGVGLHSYGFMDSAVFWLGLFMASQILLIGIGLLPISSSRAMAPTSRRWFATALQAS